LFFSKVRDRAISLVDGAIGVASFAKGATDRAACCPFAVSSGRLSKRMACVHRGGSGLIVKMFVEKLPRLPVLYHYKFIRLVV
jgi:hypothetical protein